MRAFVIFALFGVGTQAFSQSVPRSFKLDAAPSQGTPSSNSISQLLMDNRTVYMTTAKGLNVSTDGGRTFKTDWGPDGPTGFSTVAVAVQGDTIAVSANSADIMTSDGLQPVGAGLFVSTDNGITWTHTPQSEDSLSDSTVTFGRSVLKAFPIQTDINNITYSMAFYGGCLYTASWRGSLRRTSDLGKTWQRVVLPPDSLNYITQDSMYSFQLSLLPSPITNETNYNQYAFSLFSDGDTALYVGTADGIDKTTDNGFSWHHFSHQNEKSPMSGDYVTYITGRNFEGKHYIWAATRVALDPSEVSALSYSTDEGASWKYILPGHPYYFFVGLNGNVVYGGADDGLFRTSNMGRSYTTITSVYDETNNMSALSPSFSSVAIQGDTIWLGNGDGLVRGIDPGTGFESSQWRVFRTFVPIGTPSSTYFYPNPFSPSLDIGRVHFDVDKQGSSVTIRIYDFSMHVVRTLLQNAPRPMGEGDAAWNGRDDAGRTVDNGVYFYSVVSSGGRPAWGKIMVVR